MMQERKDERSIGELLSDLARETGTLVRQEVELARTEMTQKATQVGKELGVLGVGGVLAHAAVLTLIAALVLGLSSWVDLWLSALIVGLVVGIAGYVLIQRGLGALKRIDLAPRATIETLKEDQEWVKEQTS
jgi:hypothetical protein